MKTLGEFIREKRTARGFSAMELAERAKVSDGHVIYIEKGRMRPTFDVLMRLLGALSVGVEDFLEATGYSAINIKTYEGSIRIPVISWERAALWWEISGPLGPEDAEGWIESDIRGEDLFALRVEDDTMDPEFREGEMISVDPHPDVSPGDFVVIRAGKGRAALRQLKKFGSKWVLNPLNPKYQDIEVARREFEIIGRVVKKEKRY